MAWFKVDDGFYSSTKFLMIPRNHQVQAAGAWVLAGTWSADKMTDGFVPYAVMDLWEFDAEVVGELVANGLWIHDEERDGIVFHDWADYQPTREQLETRNAEKHAKKVAAGIKSGEVRRAKSEQNRTGVEQNRTNTEQNLNPEPEPVPNKEHLYSEAERKNPYSEDFETWWASYPRRQQKGDAWKAWEVLRKKRELPDISLLISSAVKYGQRVTDPQFQKLPAGWLRSACWDDEPLQAISLEPAKRKITGYAD